MDSPCSTLPMLGVLAMKKLLLAAVVLVGLCASAHAAALNDVYVGKWCPSDLRENGYTNCHNETDHPNVIITKNTFTIAEGSEDGEVFKTCRILSLKTSPKPPTRTWKTIETYVIARCQIEDFISLQKYTLVWDKGVLTIVTNPSLDRGQ